MDGNRVSTLRSLRRYPKGPFRKAKMVPFRHIVGANRQFESLASFPVEGEQASRNRKNEVKHEESERTKIESRFPVSHFFVASFFEPAPKNLPGTHAMVTKLQNWAAKAKNTYDTLFFHESPRNLFPCQNTNLPP